MVSPEGSRSVASDEDLVFRFADDEVAQADRERAFAELVHRYRHRLFAVCVRVLGDAEDAEDAVQETLVRLARNAAGFRGEAKLSTWLYRVAKNVCTDRVRYEARRPATPVADIAESHDRPDERDPIESQATVATVGAALADLDERSRQLLLLVAVDGLTYAEAAELTGLAVGTVKSRVSRARVRLGELLAESDEAHGPRPGDAPAPQAAASAEGDRPRGPPAP